MLKHKFNRWTKWKQYVERKFLSINGQEISHKEIKVEFQNKRNRTVYAVNRRVATCTVRAIQKRLKNE